VERGQGSTACPVPWQAALPLIGESHMEEELGSAAECCQGLLRGKLVYSSNFFGGT
jgi:hypothetical protein